MDVDFEKLAQEPFDDPSLGTALEIAVLTRGALGLEDLLDKIEVSLADRRRIFAHVFTNLTPIEQQKFALELQQKLRAS